MEIMVRGLPLPAALTDGGWRHPGDAVLARVVPWFEEPLDYLGTIREITLESTSLDAATDAELAAFFRTAWGPHAPELPWLKAESALVVAVGRVPGSDVALALDYRTDPADPRVVGTDFWTEPGRCAWRLVSPTLSAFLAATHREQHR